MAISQETIDGMIDTCIESIALGKDLPLYKIDQLGYLDVLSEIAESRGMKISGRISSAASILEACSALGVVSKYTHAGFIKRHELLLYIDSSLSALAHTNPRVYKSLGKTWFDKSFAEKEALLESLPRGANMKAEFIRHMNDIQGARAVLAAEKNPVKRIVLEKRIVGINDEIRRLHNKLASVFKEQVVRGVQRLSPEVAIQRLKAGGHGRSAAVLNRYADELQRRLATPPNPNKAKSAERTVPRKKGARRSGR